VLRSTAEQRRQRSMTAHPDEHRKNEEYRRMITETERGESRAGAIDDQSPTAAEKPMTPATEEIIDLTGQMVGLLVRG
jgi:hypothetical protein